MKPSHFWICVVVSVCCAACGTGGSPDDSIPDNDASENEPAERDFSESDHDGQDSGERESDEDSGEVTDVETDAGEEPTDSTDIDTGFPVGDPIPDTPIGEWKRIPIEGAQCKDGGQAGFSIRRSGVSDNVLIYQQVGGACFNKAMCNISTFGGAPFQKPSGMGIFNFRNSDNPVRDWNMIFIPYCTGDVHAGSRPDAKVKGVNGKHQFVGGDNYRLFLQRIVPTFPNATKVVFAGWSAGGFGTLLNYVDTQRAFGEDVPIVMVSDGGPPMRDAYFKNCLANRLRELWELDEYLPGDCAICFSETGGALANMLQYILGKYPDTVYGLVSAYEDSVIRMFFSYGLNNCQGTLAAYYPPAQYKEGLIDLKAYFSALDPDGKSFGTYYFNGQDHGRIDRSSFYQQTVKGHRLVDWFASIIQGNPYHVAE